MTQSVSELQRRKLQGFLENRNWNVLLFTKRFDSTCEEEFKDKMEKQILEIQNRNIENTQIRNEFFAKNEVFIK